MPRRKIKQGKGQKVTTGLGIYVCCFSNCTRMASLTRRQLGRGLNEVRTSHENIWININLGGYRKCKGPNMRVCLAYLRNYKGALVVGFECGESGRK